jgi:hypothetical protein
LNPEDQPHKSSKLAKRAGKVFSWGAIGEVIGLLAGIYIPDTFISDAMLAHILGLLMAGLSGIGIFSRFKTPNFRDLNDCLDDANRLFIKGTINETEHLRLREKCLEKFMK